jgi:Rrf2 family nitric oxide-sensitive transcriptional repressor
MRLTTFSDYSLRVLIHVATAPEERTTIGEIARAFDISEHHLVKVVHRLGLDGFLVNTRGRGGGLRLARPPREINVGSVVRAAEDGDMPAECFDPETNRCALSGACRLAGALAQAVEAFYATLDRHTLEDLVAPKRSATVAILHRRAALAR